MEVTAVSDGDFTFGFWKECPVCGKKFLPVHGHVWRDKRITDRKKLVCTYSCMRVTEREAEANVKPDGRRRRKKEDDEE